MPPTANAPLALTLGTVSFAEFEVPESIDHFCGTQKMVRHDFPGGIISIQTFGAFPPRNIRWTGHFLEGDFQPTGNAAGPGQSAQDRIDQLNVLRVAGQPLVLSFSVYQFNVVIHEFQVHPKMQWWFPYTLDLVPLQDLTPSSQPPPPSISPTGQGAGTPGSLGEPNPFSELQDSQSQLADLLQSPLGQSAAAGPTGPIPGVSPTLLTANQSQALTGSISTTQSGQISRLVNSAFITLNRVRNLPTNLLALPLLLKQAKNLLSSPTITGNTMLGVGGLIAQAQSVLASAVPVTATVRQLQAITNRIQSHISTLGISANGTSTLTAFQSSLLTSLTASLGNIKNVPSIDIFTQLAAAQQVSKLMINSKDPTEAAFGANASAQLLKIANQVEQEQGGVITKLYTVNPNLQRLARTYYKDPRKWTLIARANNLTRVQNRGVFNLVIPRLGI